MMPKRSKKPDLKCHYSIYTSIPWSFCFTPVPETSFAHICSFNLIQVAHFLSHGVMEACSGQHCEAPSLWASFIIASFCLVFWHLSEWIWSMIHLDPAGSGGAAGSMRGKRKPTLGKVADDHVLDWILDTGSFDHGQVGNSDASSETVRHSPPLTGAFYGSSHSLTILQNTFIIIHLYVSMYANYRIICIDCTVYYILYKSILYCRYLHIYIYHRSSPSLKHLPFPTPTLSCSLRAPF